MKSVILRLIPLPIAALQAAVGCELRPLQLKQVSPDLTIVVTHREKPIAGIEVKLVPEENPNEPVFTALTDENGTVLIQGLMAGRYYLSAAHRGFEAGKEWVEVTATPNKKAKRRFDFQWADWSYQTRSVAGSLTGLIPGDTGNKLMDLVHPKETVYPGVAIILRNAFSDDEYRTVSDSAGSFVIDSVPDGIYTLFIVGGMKSISGIASETTLVIDLKQTSTRDSLRLQLKDTGCYSAEFELDDKQS